MLPVCNIRWLQILDFLLIYSSCTLTHFNEILDGHKLFLFIKVTFLEKGAFVFLNKLFQ